MKKKLTVKSLLLCWIFWIAASNEAYGGKSVKIVLKKVSVVMMGIGCNCKQLIQEKKTS
jgi:hypothetical protein